MQANAVIAGWTTQIQLTRSVAVASGGPDLKLEWITLPPCKLPLL